MVLRSALPALASTVALGIPLAYSLGVLSPPIHSARTARTTAYLASVLALLLVVVMSGCKMLGVRASSPLELIRIDGPSLVMLLLVTGLGVVIVRYASSYLRNEAAQPQFFRPLSVALASVTCLVLSKHLLLMAIAWFATSVAVHHLLTYYGGRREALIAAHKKFIVSRMADTCLVVGMCVIGATLGTLDLDGIRRAAGASSALEPTAQLGLVLIVAAALLRSAQIPFHGWLTQVMEAPTPVSALLHAGVVNVGGYVLIRLSPALEKAPVAMAYLTFAGTVTAVIGSLVQTTRVSVKLSLAWSTVAQIGFMMVECGLGAWPLALLHLVAHSLYKAQAFLSAGSTVESWYTSRLAPMAKEQGVRRALGGFVAAVAALSVLGIVGLAISRDAKLSSIRTDSSTLLLVLSVVPLGAQLVSPSLWRVAGRAASITVLGFASHQVARVIGAPPAGTPQLFCVIIAGTGALVVLTAHVSFLFPRTKALAERVQPLLFAAGHLDELFSGALFRLLPPPVPKKPKPIPEAQPSPTFEVQG